MIEGKPYLTKIWWGRTHWIYVRTRRRYRLYFHRMFSRFVGVVSYKRSDYS